MKLKRGIGLVIIVGCLVGAGLVLSQVGNYASTKTAQARTVDSTDGAGPAMVIRTATKSERAGAIKSITAQLNAFKRNDYEGATKYQSKSLSRSISSVLNFRRMIVESYPEFSNYKSADFGDAKANASGSFVEIPVHLTGEDGISVDATYEMILEDGEYHVVGVIGGFRQLHALPKQPSPPVRIEGDEKLS